VHAQTLQSNQALAYAMQALQMWSGPAMTAPGMFPQSVAGLGAANGSLPMTMPNLNPAALGWSSMAIQGLIDAQQMEQGKWQAGRFK